MSDLRQTLAWATYLKKIGWTVEKAGNSFGYIKKFPALGSFIKIQRPQKLNIKKIEKLAQKHRAFQVSIEPKPILDAQRLPAAGFRLSKSPYLPSKTLRLDLTKTESAIFGQLKKDAKYALRKTQKLKTARVKDIEDFVNHWRRAVGWKRSIPSATNLAILKETFGRSCLLCQCLNTLKPTTIKISAGRQPVAGAVFVIANRTAYYLYAFTSPEGRKVLAQYKILWEGILWAKRRGARIFDFEGIFDTRFPRKSWLGFTHFKKSFGGYAVEYPGCFVKSYTIAGKLISLVDT